MTRSRNRRKGGAPNRVLLAGGLATIAGAAALAPATMAASNPSRPVSAPAAPVAAAAPNVQAAAMPKFQLPFSCGQRWRLDAYDSDHNPALDMVREPNQHGTEGASVLAPAAGEVVISTRHRNAGNMVQLKHSGRYHTTFLHLKTRTVSKGTWVPRGAKLGTVGKDGPTANGHPHLHYEQGYDRNNNGLATWGQPSNERVAAYFNGKRYTGTGKTWRNVKSSNKCSLKKYSVVTAQTVGGYRSPSSKTRVGTLNKGRNYVYCARSGRRITLGKVSSSYWLYTDLDSGNGTGWVPGAYTGVSGRPTTTTGALIPFCVI